MFSTVVKPKREVLERIKTIRAEEDEQQDTLFRNVEDVEFNEDLPDFLKGEDFVRVDVEDGEAV